MTPQETIARVLTEHSFVLMEPPWFSHCSCHAANLTLPKVATRTLQLDHAQHVSQVIAEALGLREETEPSPAG